MTEAILIAASLLLATLRIYGVKDPAFQAVAHVFVGGLAGVLLLTWGEKSERRVFWLVLFWGLVVVEVACAWPLIAAKFKGA